MSRRGRRTGYGVLTDDDLPAAAPDGGRAVGGPTTAPDGSGPHDAAVGTGGSAAPSDSPGPGSPTVPDAVDRPDSRTPGSRSAGPARGGPPDGRARATAALSRATGDGLPYYRFGRGDRPLVVLPGANDAFAGETDLQTGGLLARELYGRFAADFDVWVVSRPRGLAGGTTTRGMAADVARLLRHLGPDPVDVLGISMGGLVATHLAADYPSLVDRLVLGATAARLGEDGRRTVERWREHAANGDWRALAVDTVDETYGRPRSWLYPPGLLGLPRAVLRPPNLTDPLVSFRATLDHDGTAALGAVDAPTLVVGGADDRLFPPALQREAASLAGGRAEVVEGTGHGVFEERKGAFDRTVASFLRE